VSPAVRAPARSRVLLRALRRSDRGEFLDLMRASRSFHRGRVEPPLTPTAFARYLQQLREPNRVGFLICRRDDGGILGVINLNEISRGPAHTAFLGYYVGAAHAGRGYMREALELVQRHAFRGLRLHRLEADIQPGNAASIALVQSCGFRFEGTLRRFLKIGGRWRDHVIYARLAEEWRAAGRSSAVRPQPVSLRFRPRVNVRALEELRALVGWEPLGGGAGPFLRGLWGSAAAFDANRLVAWIGIVSDGTQHAFLVDVMVAPEAQGRGVGTELVRFASRCVRERGIRLLHVDFVPGLARFYERCGFRAGLGGVLAHDP
jgi:ribosomal-protein-alanine N-acetyltransferase